MKVLTAEQIKNAEDNAVKCSIFSYTELMKRAGDSASQEIISRYNVKNKKVCIVCGNGNNGGDGLVIASNLKKNGANVFLLTPIGFPSTDTALCFKDDIVGIDIIDDLNDDFDIIIDALFGIGLNRELSGNIAKLIEKINSYDCLKIAVDIPSGLFCDGGKVNTAFKADLTLSFTCYKLCQLLPQTSEYCGETVVLDIGLKTDNYLYPTIDRPQKINRPKNSHKGTFGTALICCGSYGMCGAEVLASRAALRSGVGIVKAFVCDKNYAAFTNAVPEAVTIPVISSENGAPLISEEQMKTALFGSNALLIGCGLGRSKDIKNLVLITLNITNIPTVIDADGINALQDDINIIRKIKAPVIITPHPAEMARLCGVTTSDIESNRVKYAQDFAIKNSVYLVLKGTNTIVATPDGQIYFNTTGNDGLATGGSGDVLSGMIVSRLAQGYDPLTATTSSVWLHGAIADELAKQMSTRAILPSDIIEGLKTISD